MRTTPHPYFHFLLPVLAALLAALLACSEKAAQDEDSESKSAVSVESPFVGVSEELPTPFGQVQSSQCYFTCFEQTNERVNCDSLCSRYQVQEFASTPLSLRPTAKQSAERVKEACSQQAPLARDAEPAAEWLKLQEALLVFVREAPRSVLVYEKETLRKRLSAVQRETKTLLPVTDEDDLYVEFYSRLRLELCLRTALVASQLAVLDAANRDDMYAESYYRTVEAALIELSVETEQELPRLYGEAIQQMVERGMEPAKGGTRK